MNTKKLYLLGANTITPKNRKLYLILGIILVIFFICLVIIEIIKKDYDKILLPITNAVYGSI